MSTREVDQRSVRASATQRYRFPTLRLPTSGTPDQMNFYRSVKQWIELREGAGGNDQEAVVLRRDLTDAGLTQRVVTQLIQANNTPTGSSGDIPGTPNTIGGGHRDGGSAADALNRLAQALFSSRLFVNLMKGTLDPTRFSDFSPEVQAILLRRIDEEAKARGAAIRRLEQIVQTGTRSQAIAVEEVTASVLGAMAGVRVTTFATAEAGRATAGRVTQVSASLDVLNGQVADVEETLFAQADAITGLYAQWTMKVTAGGAFGGIGLAASAPLIGPATSYLLFVANKIGFVTDTEVIGTGPGQINPVSPPANRLMFGLDSNGAYVGGNLNVTGKAIIEGSFSKNGFNAALHVNGGKLAQNGIITYADGTGVGARYALNALATGGANAIGAGATGSGVGGIFAATGGTAIGLVARAALTSGAALVADTGGFGSMQVQLVTSAYSVYSAAGQGKHYAVDGLGPFTGFHDALLPLPLVDGDYEPQVGDIVVDDELVQAEDVSNSLFTAVPCTQAGQRGAIGIISESREIDDSIGLSYERWWSYQHTHMRLFVNAVGEGQINVCGRGGDIARGDLIECSDMTGKGQRQADDIVRSKTVAKARMAVVFSHPDEVKLVPCVYLCG